MGYPSESLCAGLFQVRTSAGGWDRRWRDVITFGILGPLTVARESTEIGISGGRRRSLLLRLLISANQPVSAERLAEDLWEGSPTPGAISTLQSHLSFLRSKIGSDRIQRETAGYRIRVGQGELDAQLFEAESRDGRNLLAACEFDASDNLLTSALGRWRGPALSDVLSGLWAIPEASRLEELRLVTLEAHHEALLARARNGDVVASAEAAVVENPLREKLWGQLMLALYRSGRQAEALQAYQRLKGQLVEVGLMPTRELIDLENAIVLQDPELDWVSSRREVTARLSIGVRNVDDVDDGNILPDRIQADESEFVGRSAELTTLDHLFKEVVSDQSPILALLTGEPGIGKTSLAAAAARAAHRSGARVFYGRNEQYLGVPYQAWREVLERLLGQAPSLIPDEALEPSGVLRAFGLGPNAALERPVADEMDIYLLFQGVVSILAGAAEPSGLVLVLDDLQWSDAQSIQLLRRFLEGATASPILVIGTMRDSELSTGSTVAALLSELRRQPKVHRIGVKGLNDLEVLALIGQQVIHTADDESLIALRDVLLRETNGNPFFVGELVRHLEESGAFGGENATHDGFSGMIRSLDVLPTSVSEVIGERVARLGEGAAQTLLVASVMGREFELVIVGSVRQLPVNELLDHLDSAVGSSLVVDHGGGRFGFTHSLVARSLYDGLSPTRRAYIHAQIAAAIEEECEGAPDRSAELAHHWMQASLPQNVNKALTYAKSAADHALGHLAPDEARRWYQQALDLLTSGSDEELRCELMVGLGDATRQGGDPDHRRILLDAARQAIRIENDELLVRAALANSRGFFSEAGHVDQDRVEILRAAADRTVGKDAALRARVLSLLAAELAFDDDYQSRLSIANEALTIARDCGDSHAHLTVLNYRIAAIQGPDILDEILRNTDEALSLAEHVDNTDAVSAGFAAGWRYMTAWQACDRSEVDRMWQLMKQSAENIGQPTVRWFVGFLASHRAFVAAELDESQRLADENLKLGMETGQPDALNIFGAQVLRITRERDGASDLIPMLQQVVAENTDDDTANTVLGRFYCDIGDLDAARNSISQYVGNSFRTIRRDLFWMTSMSTIADTVADLGWQEAARSLLPQLAPYMHQWDVIGPSSNGPVALSVARLAALVGDSELAETGFTTALSLAERFVSPLYQARTLLDWGRALQSDSPDDARGETCLKRSRDIAQQHNLRLIERLAY